MSKRLQVVVPDEEMKRYEGTAKAAGVTLSEWARQALRAAQREMSDGDIDAKLAVIRKAATYNFPGPESDIETMLAEIESAQLAEIESGMGPAGD